MSIFVEFIITRTSFHLCHSMFLIVAVRLFFGTIEPYKQQKLWHHLKYWSYKSIKISVSRWSNNGRYTKQNFAIKPVKTFSFLTWTISQKLLKKLFLYLFVSWFFWCIASTAMNWTLRQNFWSHHWRRKTRSTGISRQHQWSETDLHLPAKISPFDAVGWWSWEEFANKEHRDAHVNFNLSFKMSRDTRNHALVRDWYLC